MKHIIKYTYLTLLATVGLTSCDDYLDVAPVTGDSVEDFLEGGLGNTQKALIATYSSLYSASLYDVDLEAFRSDIAYPGERAENQHVAGFPWYNKQFSETTTLVESKWKSLYDGILRANLTIKGLNTIAQEITETGTEDEKTKWNSQMAQVRFLRGLYYFYLHSTYNNGNIVIRDNVPTSLEDYSVPLSTSAKVKEYYLEDLNYALEHLEAVNEDELTKTIPTQGSALTILGMVDLYAKDYEAAKEKFERVVTDFNYELERDFSLLFTTAGEFNKESIFEVSFTNEGITEDGSGTLLKLVNGYGKSANDDGVSNYTPSHWLMNEYSIEPIDPLNTINQVADGNGGTYTRTTSLRAASMIALPQDTITSFYGNAKAIMKLTESQDNGFYSIFKKYTNHDIVPEKEDDLPGGRYNSGKNLIVNRLSEVHLMLAECYILTGNLDKALENINKVRERWGLVLYGLTGAFDDGNHTYDGITYTTGLSGTLMQKLMYVDKPLETCLEGHAVRTNDLRRWGVTKQRFIELSELTFGLKPIVYTGTSILGVADTSVDAGMVISGDHPDFDPVEELDREYLEAATNYVNEIHDYLPIPLNERTNNGAVN